MFYLKMQFCKIFSFLRKECDKARSQKRKESRFNLLNRESNTIVINGMVQYSVINPIILKIKMISITLLGIYIFSENC